MLQPLRHRSIPKLFPEFLTNADRRRLLFSAAALTSGVRASAAGPAAPQRASTDPDGPLLAACAGFSNVERQRIALYDGPCRIEDDDVRDAAMTPLMDQQLLFLNAMCAQRASGLAGHRARAIAFWLWDGGELAYRALQSNALEDRLLAALVRDLAATSVLTVHSNPDRQSRPDAR